jgi:RNA polymerase sigma-70 factor (ECF subfamily)
MERRYRHLLNEMPEPSGKTVPFRELVREQAAFVLRLVRRLGVRDGDVDDVAQEVFLTVHRRYAEWDGQRALLFAIVRRAVANFRRKASNEHTAHAGLAQEPTPHSMDPARAAEQNDARRVLERALEALSDEQREVFVLFELEGMEMQELAIMVGCSLKTAYSRLYAARATVKRAVLRRVALEAVR